MAAVSAGTGTGFNSVSRRNKSIEDAVTGGKYKTIFSKLALRHKLEEQRLHEQEYLMMRRRSYRRRKLKESTDPYKKLAISIHPWGLLATVLGLLSSCCGFLEEWSKTFPLGDITNGMYLSRVIGLFLLLVGIGALTITHLYYHKNETGTFSHPDIPFKVITSEEAASRKHKKSTEEKILIVSKLVFQGAMTLLILSFLAFCTGSLPAWHNSLPATLTDGTKKVLTIGGTICSVFAIIVMITMDLIQTRVRESKVVRKERRVLLPESRTECTIFTTDSSQVAYAESFNMGYLYSISKGVSSGEDDSRESLHSAIYESAKNNDAFIEHSE